MGRLFQGLSADCRACLFDVLVLLDFKPLLELLPFADGDSVLLAPKTFWPWLLDAETNLSSVSGDLLEVWWNFKFRMNFQLCRVRRGRD
jgi:hypothetical protein